MCIDYFAFYEYSVPQKSKIPNFFRLVYGFRYVLVNFTVFQISNNVTVSINTMYVFATKNTRSYQLRKCVVEDILRVCQVTSMTVTHIIIKTARFDMQQLSKNRQIKSVQRICIFCYCHFISPCLINTL